MGTLFGIKAFAVAILGGINNAWGVVVAGLIYGIAEALITSLLGSTYTQIMTFGLVIVALLLRPSGLFGRAEVKKV
jgi:branched-chain amino acid transport system permease protein